MTLRIIPYTLIIIPIIGFFTHQNHQAQLARMADKL